MAENAERASRVLAPKQGDTKASSVSTSASSAIDLGVTEGPGVFFTFESNVETFLLLGDSNVVAPDENAVSGNQQCYRIPADGEKSYLITPKTRYLRHKGSASGTLRYHKSSE